MATGGSDKVERICYYYNTPGGCWRDSRCNFQHVRDESGDDRPICRFYGTSKKCWYGRDCYFRHEKPDARPQPHGNLESRDIKLVMAQSGVSELEAIYALKENENDIVLAIMSTQSKKKPAKKSKPKSHHVKKPAVENPIPTGTETETKQTADDNNNDETLAKETETETVDEAAEGMSAMSIKDKAEEGCGHAVKESEDGAVVESVCDECMEKKGENSEGKAGNKLPRAVVGCGECGEEFRDGEDGKSAYTALETHYFDMLGKADREHVKIFHENEGFLKDKCMCGACGRIFRRPEDLLRHLGSKYLAKSERHEHKEYFWDIVHQFVDRDTGMTSDDEEDMVDFLMVLMLEHYTGCDEDESDSCDDYGMTSYIATQLRRLSKMTDQEIEDESDERAENCGFTNDEMEDLMCQGIKPWDSEAYAALAVLNGGADFYDSDY